MSEREAIRKVAYERIRWMRDVAGLTLSEIADRLDSSHPVISRWYNYEKTKQLPSYGMAKRILRLAEVVAEQSSIDDTPCT